MDEGSAAEAARAHCLRLLTGQPRTRAELERALARRGVADDVVEDVLDGLERAGLVDDEAFASAWVTSRQRGRGLARRALSSELRRKGVPDETVAAAVATVDPDDESEAGRALVRRRLSVMRGLDAPTRFRRLTGLLLRRGYGAGQAAAIVRAVLAEDTDEMSPSPSRSPRRG